MTKRFLLISLLCLCIGAFGLLVLPQVHASHPNAQVLVDTTDRPFTLPTLFYSDIQYKYIRGYDWYSGTLTPQQKNYVPYTEGFIEKTLYTRLIDAIMAVSPQAAPYFHDYYLEDTFAAVAYSGGLENIYLVDLQTDIAYPLTYLPEDNLGFMYVSHMRRVGDTLIILGGEANAYTSLIYTISLQTGEVLHAKRLATPLTALYKEDFAILSSGTCAFTGESSVLLYNPFTDTTSEVPFDTSPSRLLNYDDTLLVISEEVGQLTLWQLEDTLPLTLTLPLPDYRIVDMLIEDDLLVVALFDPADAHYHNYLSVYDLDTGSWLYCLGLVAPTNQALLFLQ